MRPDWTEWGLLIARAVATRADCTRRQVGAVVLDQHHRVVATGYNGAPPGARGCLAGGCPRGLLNTADPYSSYDTGPGLCISNHAEANALLHGDRSKYEGGTLYVTDQPCVGCARLIANSGIREIVWPGTRGTAPASLLQEYLCTAEPQRP